MTKYETITQKPGKYSKWVNPTHEGGGGGAHRMRCCDCGLVHEFQFRSAKEVKGGFEIVPGLKTLFRVRRHAKATSASRRTKKYKKKIKELQR